jgi:hypothetical protein
MGAQMKRWHVIAVVVALSMIVAAIATARAHVAVSGWSYPFECCSTNDCYAIPEEEVKLEPGGAYRVIRTNEVFHHPDAQNLDPMARKFKWSGDAQFHRCSSSGDPKDKTSICLFVPPPGA